MLGQLTIVGAVEIRAHSRHEELRLCRRVDLHIRLDATAPCADADVKPRSAVLADESCRMARLGGYAQDAQSGAASDFLQL